MSSFYAELEVGGRTYPVRRCHYDFTQATDERGRVRAKVRHGLIQLSLDVPEDEFLLSWGTTAHKPLPGHVTFFGADRRTARETVSFTAGECVSYFEDFRTGNGTDGAYICHLTIAAPKLVLMAGGPPRTMTPAPSRDYATAPTAVAALMKAPLPTKQQRYDTRMKLMHDAHTQLAAGDLIPTAGPLSAPIDATRVAPMGNANALAVARGKAKAAVDRLARNNVAVERARLSEHVYNSDKIPPVPAPEGWHQLTTRELARRGITPAMIKNPVSGFKAALYESSFERPPKLVVAFAGTENKVDWTTNLQQGIGLETDQYNRAMKLGKRVLETSNLGKFDITGHSLGGGLASAAVVVTGAKGYTFNAAALHPNTVARFPYSISEAGMVAKGQLIDAYHSTADPLTNLQSGLAYAPESQAIPFVATSPKLMVAGKALGQPYALDPAAKWQHGWGELASSHPLDSATTMGLDGHGVDPQLVDHIEAQKDADTETLTHFVNPRR